MLQELATTTLVRSLTLIVKQWGKHSISFVTHSLTNVRRPAVRITNSN